MSDSDGDTVQTYKYSVFGQVAAEDTDHPNPYMFTGRRYDKEIGLYYYRARYYNPYVGRFLQTDPVGYEAGINLYMYCHNNPLNFKDPSGLYDIDAVDPCGADPCDLYLEWTGEFKITNWRRLAWQDDVCDTVKKIGATLKWTGRGALIITILTLNFSASNVADQASGIFASTMEQVGDAIPDFWENTEDAYSAWIKVKKYKKRHGIWGDIVGFFGDDGYDYLGEQWLEVTSGNTLYGIGYLTKRDAIDAIREEIASLPYRPRDENGNVK